MSTVKGILIEGIGPIKNLKLNFNDHFNIICGTNGIGKTTILECIAHSFITQPTPILKKNADCERGKWILDVMNDMGHISERVFHITVFEPYVSSHPLQLDYYFTAEEIIVFKSRRDIEYRMVKGIESDPLRKKENNSSLALLGIDSNNLKTWFINRYLWSAHENVLTLDQRNNFDLAKSIFSILDPDITFHSVIPTNDILVKTPTGIIYYEYLSSGYKSALSVLLGIITEIEFRFKNPRINVTDFDGIIIIDELDLHLHPEFQTAIYKGLKKIVPSAQVFTTTHSPHIIQVAEPDEIIALEISPEDKMIRQKNLSYNSVGYKGWTLEEILTEVAGLKDTKSQEYYEKLQCFDTYMDNEDVKGATEAYKELKKILHPRNEIIRLMEIQLAGLGVVIND